MKAGAAIDALWHRTSRALLGRRRVGLLRWIRSKRDLRRLARADVAVVSFAKSGRTWLRVMLSRLLQTKYGLPEDIIIERDNLHRLNKAIPVFLFTQGSYIEDVRPLGGAASPYHGKRLIFLARHPADTAVSYYFHTGNRINPLKKDLKRLPEDLSDTTLVEFVMNESWGMPAIVRYHNAWADALAAHPRHLLVRYEDLRRDPRPELERISRFLGESFEATAYEEAIEFASFERLQQKERANFFGNQRLQPRDPANPDSFKVRRGKVGGYLDYFNDREAASIAQLIAAELNPIYGYGEPLPPNTDARMADHSVRATSPDVSPLVSRR
jgi:hypothetical protein